MLWQFQCQKEGSIFYYQHGSRQSARYLVSHCPICGSKKVGLTGLVYSEVDERTSDDV